MTAIAGVWRFDGRPDAGSVCTRMLAAQKIYGIHDTSAWDGGEIGLGRCLMRVLPEEAFDHQPLARDLYVLIADVRLDNREELAKAIGVSTSDSGKLADAAILLKAIERWHESCLERLVGDFAFAFWNTRRRELKLVRDPLGQRPLHYHRGNRFIAFASMPKGLHAIADIPYAPDMERVAETLLLMPETGRRSFFKDIERVEPGHVVTITDKGLSVSQYWRPVRRRVQLARASDYGEAVLALLDQAVRARMRSTGVVATQLSGGLDSSAVTASAALALAKSGGRLPAFTSVPRKTYRARKTDRVVDEGPLAAATAALYPNVDHVLVFNEGRSPTADLDRGFYLYDRPLHGISGAGWSYSLYRALAGHDVKVLLTGEFGNMTLSYDGLELLSEDFASGHWLRLLREWRALVSRGMSWRGPLGLILAPRISPALWLRLRRLAGRPGATQREYSALNFDYLGRIDRDRMRTHDVSFRPWKNGFDQRLWALHRVDPGNFRKGGLGGFGIDVRDPTADTRLVEFCLSIPTEQYLRNGMPRALALGALAGRLPEAVLREERRGLATADWFEDMDRARCDLARELEATGACEDAREIIDIPRLHELVENWPSDWQSDDVVTSHRYVLPRAIAAGHFIRRATRSNR